LAFEAAMAKCRVGHSVRGYHIAGLVVGLRLVREAPSQHERPPPGGEEVVPDFCVNNDENTSGSDGMLELKDILVGDLDIV
jgi:hypothetical protein